MTDTRADYCDGSLNDDNTPAVIVNSGINTTIRVVNSGEIITVLALKVLCDTGLRKHSFYNRAQ